MYPGVAYEPVPFAEELGLSFSSPWEHPDPKYVDNEFIKAVYAELPQIPTPQVWGSLMTEISRDRHRTGGKGTANDVYDVFRAAIAIPVVRLYGTDGGMKGLLDRSGIADEFGVEVYSARRDDPENFICAVRALPSGCSA